MPNTNNIDCFNEAVIRTLSVLYKSFPIPSDLNISEIAVDTDHLKTTVPARSIFFETVNFLALEGFIRSSSRSERGGLVFIEVSLTSTALLRLNMSPRTLQNSLIDEINHVLALPAEKRTPQLVSRCVVELFRSQ